VVDDSHFFQPILLKMARLMTTREERKLEKLLIFLLAVAFSMFFFFRKYIGPTVTVSVGKSSSGDCHIVTVGPRF
jgi:hypothetical protein